MQVAPGRCHNCTCWEREPWRWFGIPWELGLFRLRVFEVLHDDELHPYHYSRGAFLLLDHHPLRMHFANGYDTHTADDLFLHEILRTDACFTREGAFTVHSSHLRSRGNPIASLSSHLSVSIWAGIVGDIVVGPNVLPDRPTAQPLYWSCVKIRV
jgi:hypothetical protein